MSKSNRLGRNRMPEELTIDSVYLRIADAANIMRAKVIELTKENVRLKKEIREYQTREVSGLNEAMKDMNEAIGKAVG